MRDYSSNVFLATRRTVDGRLLQRVLPGDGLVLEVASGTGQHVVHFAAALTGSVWQPSDSDEAMLESIDAYVSASGLTNVAAPIFLDARMETAPSNAEFDSTLRRRDPEWGVRDLDDVTALAQGHGFTLEQVIAMPANDLTVVFRAGPAESPFSHL